MASLRPSFGCVLRDRNQRHSDNDVVVKKKAQVKAAPPQAISDESSQNRVDSLIGNKRRKNNKSRLGSPEKPSTRKWNDFSDSLGGASSLVQIWEARLNRSNGRSTESSSSEASVQEIHLPDPPIDGESESENESNTPDRTVEIESRTLISVSDFSESKWGRVGEMIRRLSNEQKLTARDNVGAIHTPATTEKRSFPVVTCSPRIRGRQALSDLLVHLERERHRELESLLGRNAVSRFSQRGRLQSMLRLRSLKRGLAIQDRHRGSTKGDLNRFQPSSKILHLREKFREHTSSNAAAEAERIKGQQSTVETESMRPREISIISDTPSTKRLSPQNRNKDEGILCKKETESKMGYLQLKEAIVAEVLKRNSDKYSPINCVTHQEPGEEEANKVESAKEGTQETHLLAKQETSFQNRWEEQEEYEDEQSYYGDMSYDWFTDVSRPRSYWEDLRKSRYLEVMNTRSDKDDICRLLERRTVSGFLQSGLREKIDKLIMSRVQTHPAQRVEKACREEEKCDVGEEGEDRDDSSQLSLQIFAPSPAGSWSSQDTGVTSTPIHTYSQSSAPSTPMHNLNSNLQLDMSELRDSVKTCLDLNAGLQKSVHPENPLKRKCCVCNETQIETLLYRCGHMCTCMRCANELQHSGGKCPICRAKILDVVRVFVDSRA
ncbi:hypothetical protein CARUB_v10024916mg [Capsella rubella]|uniref:RING-type domain-containing protein n=1 Tax=Capsella rubella TaxID=81985 RepID=R0HTG5_9BRAS|nr:hypothetical protein CARUB_v10024916mg [Capsella rubella]